MSRIGYLTFIKENPVNKERITKSMLVNSDKKRSFTLNNGSSGGFNQIDSVTSDKLICVQS